MESQPDGQVEGGVAPVGDQSRIGQGPAPQVARHMGGGGAQNGVVDVPGQLDGPLLHRSVGEDHDQKSQVGAEVHQLDRPDGGRVVGGAHHHGGVVRQVGQEAAGVTQEVLDGTVDVGEEPTDLLALHRTERPWRSQRVDEEPVALVGGDPAGAGVGLGQVAITLERSHVAAHGGRRHLDARGSGDMGRTHRLGRLDVLRHDGVQDGGLAGIEFVPIGAGGPEEASGGEGPGAGRVDALFGSGP